MSADECDVRLVYIVYTTRSRPEDLGEELVRMVVRVRRHLMRRAG